MDTVISAPHSMQDTARSHPVLASALQGVCSYARDTEGFSQKHLKWRRMFPNKERANPDPVSMSSQRPHHPCHSLSSIPWPVSPLIQGGSSAQPPIMPASPWPGAQLCLTHSKKPTLSWRIRAIPLASFSTYWEAAMCQELWVTPQRIKCSRIPGKTYIPVTPTQNKLTNCTHDSSHSQIGLHSVAG